MHYKFIAHESLSLTSWILVTFKASSSITLSLLMQLLRTLIFSVLLLKNPIIFFL